MNTRIDARALAAGAVLALTVLALPAQGQSPAGSFSPWVDDKGQISLPKDFRTRFVHLGSWAVTDEKSASRGMHDVYTEASSVEHYRRTGRFPDGATLVKEVRAFSTGGLTTGNPVLWAGDPAVWFVMVKDGRGRFAGNPLWADGWGWALFKADAPQRNVATRYETDCQACHIPASKTDRVFIQGYPTLGGRRTGQTHMR